LSTQKVSGTPAGSSLAGTKRNRDHRAELPPLDTARRDHQTWAVTMPPDTSRSTNHQPHHTGARNEGEQEGEVNERDVAGEGGGEQHSFPSAGHQHVEQLQRQQQQQQQQSQQMQAICQQQAALPHPLTQYASTGHVPGLERWAVGHCLI